MAKQIYDLLVIGAGPAGSGAAATAAEQGHRVALAERDKIGGTCLNYGCDPTKALLHTARLLHSARNADQYGLRIRDAEADWAAIQARVRALIDTLRGGDNAQARKKLADDGIDVLPGAVRFVSAHEVAVGEQSVYADRIIIAAGSAPAIPDIDGLDAAGFITNKQAIALPRLPRRLAIVGGGPIGVEFAQMFRRFGVDVTVLEQGEAMLAKDDRELADQLCSLLEGEGVRMETGVELRRIRRDGAEKRLTLRCADRAEEQLTVDEILVATGYQPALESLDLASAGIEHSDTGIVADPTLRTSVPHIWAAGDILGGYQFTHVAYEQGRLAAQNAFAAAPLPFDDRAIPWVTYTDPELAHVGKTEEQLRKAKATYRVGRKKMDAVERAVVTGQTAGLVKLLVGADGLIAGGHILSAEAGELIAPIVLAMRSDLPAEALATAILPYPTLAEGVRWAAEESAKTTV
jgi:pyruvate/2-oxoglutarate dehydrogenase complex dihydrolipoamide dehydrogenase (E3) component